MSEDNDDTDFRVFKSYIYELNDTWFRLEQSKVYLEFMQNKYNNLEEFNEKYNRKFKPNIDMVYKE